MRKVLFPFMFFFSESQMIHKLNKNKIKNITETERTVTETKEFNSRKKDHLPSFFFIMMVPCNLLIFQHFWNFYKTSQMNTLSISDYNFLLLYTRIAYIICLVTNILYNEKCCFIIFYLKIRTKI